MYKYGRKHEEAMNIQHEYTLRCPGLLCEITSTLQIPIYNSPCIEHTNAGKAKLSSKPMCGSSGG